MRIAGIVLAAGAATRFGEPKQLLDWDGVPLVVHVSDMALQAGLEPVIVVLGHEAEAVGSALGARRVERVTNWRWEEGLSTSVQAGLAALPPETEAAILLQCDQPLVTADLLRSLAARFEESGAPIVHPTHAGQRGTPTLFAQCLFAELARVKGDVGGRAVIARHSEEVASVEITDGDLLADLDTPADYERLVARTQRPKPDLRAMHHLIVDMDGVLWRGEGAVAGLKGFFQLLRQQDVGFVLATNNSSRTAEQYVEKLTRFGVEVAVERILTSAEVAAAYLAGIAPRGTRVYAIGEDGVDWALERRGFVVAEEGAGYVVVGWDRHLTWEKLATAALLIHGGAGFIGTNPDVSYPTERGPVPGNGAQLAALEAATGVAPVVVGKPEPPMYEEALKRMGARPETTAVIGDRLDTDLLGGAHLGLTTVLVLSGIATEADVADSEVRPDLVYGDIQELTHAWRDQWGS